MEIARNDACGTDHGGAARWGLSRDNLIRQSLTLPAEEQRRKVEAAVDRPIFS